MRLFVYGTLKRGMRLHYYLHGQRFVREDKTVPEYLLFGVHRTTSFPMLFHVGPDTGVAVRGEVWDVDDDCLDILDMLEGYPYFYDRQSVKLESGETVTAYIPKHLTKQERSSVVGDNWDPQPERLSLS